jgi:hypothetical protein
VKNIWIYLLVCLTHIAFAQQTWQLQKNDNGIKVFTSESTISSVKAVKVEIEFNQPIEKIAAAIMNVASYKNWIYGCIESTLISQPNDSELTYRHVTGAPWPFEDRDQVSKFIKRTNKTTGQISITSSIQSGYPEQKGYVRIKHSTASWVLIPQKNGTVKATYNLSFDPGGNIPSWLMNLFITDGPYQSFSNLKKLLEHS